MLRLASLASLLVCAVVAQQTTVLYGSCHSVNLPVSPLWPHIIDAAKKAAPNAVWIWGGDNVYADRLHVDRKYGLPWRKYFTATTPKILKSEYAKLNALPEYVALKKTGATILATIDDHDFGMNDGDSTSFKNQDFTKELFLNEFLHAPKDDPRWTHEGVYSQYDVSPSLKVILLDNRSSKDPYSLKEEGTMLGDSQFEWLEDVLCASTARVHLIATGLQVLPTHRAFGESWSRFPKSRQRLFTILKKCQVKAPLLLSGDVHMAELLEAKCDGENTLVEVTSSGMTHSWSTRFPTWIGEYTSFNKFMHFVMVVAQSIMPWNFRMIDPNTKKPSYYLGMNYASVVVDEDAQELRIDIRGDDGKSAMGVTKTFAELDFSFDDGKDAMCVQTVENGGDPSAWNLKLHWFLTGAVVVLGICGPPFAVLYVVHALFG